MKLLETKKYILGLSGGPDSIFLFLKMIEELPKEHIVACHVNYNYREDSYNDEKIVRELCEKHGVQLYVKNLEINYNDFSGNFEAYAREVRYKYFLEIGTQLGIDSVCIAHHKNDLVETYILQKNRKSIVSWYGLKEETTIMGMKVIRPLLKYKKSEIVSFLNDNNVEYAIDSTNFDDNFERNRIRKQLNDDMLDDYVIKINNDNNDLKELVNEIKFTDEDFFYVDKFNEYNDIQRELFIHDFLIKNIDENKLRNRKHAIVKEILKQLRSTKSYLKITFDDILIVKDREICYILSDVFSNVYKVIDQSNIQEVEMFDNYVDIKSLVEKHEKIICRNDFLEYQTKLIYKNKTIKELYSDKKTPYIWKIKNLICHLETDDIVLNNNI